jgi:hypothetical protein
LETAKNWNRNEAQLKHEIRKRSVQTKSGGSLFKFFDGATMMSYSRSSHNQDVIGCSQLPQPNWCDQKAKLEIAKLLDSNEVEKMDVNSSLPKGAQCEDQDTESCTWSDDGANHHAQFVYHES